MKHLVAPELFVGLEEYADSLGSGHIAIDEAVSSGSQIVAFLNSFFEQFFRNVFNVTIRNPSDIDRASAESLRASRTLSPEEAALVMSFEDYCRRAPDIYGSEYGGYAHVYEEFHREFLLYFVDEAVAWTRTTADAALIEAASQARDAYEAVV